MERRRIKEFRAREKYMPFYEEKRHKKKFEKISLSSPLVFDKEENDMYNILETLDKPMMSKLMFLKLFF